MSLEDQIYSEFFWFENELEISTENSRYLPPSGPSDIDASLLSDFSGLLFDSSNPIKIIYFLNSNKCLLTILSIIKSPPYGICVGTKTFHLCKIYNFFIDFFKTVLLIVNNTRSFNKIINS